MKNFYLRLLLLITPLFFAANPLFAQVTITQSSVCPTYTLTGTFTGTTPINSGLYSDDDYSAVINIGFTFNYYGTPYTQLVIGENGQLTFNTALAGSYDPWPISAALLGNSSAYNTICAPWCDIESMGPPADPILYSVQGTAPFRSFAAIWCGDHMFSCTAQWTTTQIVIYETTGVIEAHIGHKTVCAGWNGGYAICGVQNASGTAATVAPGRDYPSVWTATNESWRFTPNAAGTAYTVAPIAYAPIPYASSAIYWYNTTAGTYLGTGATVVVTPTVTTTYEAAVLGCNDTEKTFITLNPLNCSGPIVNTPCVGDSLKFDDLGDSTGATYIWYGPAPSTTIVATTQTFTISPSTWADTGIFHVVKTIGGVHDTGIVHVVLHPVPEVTASNNGPLCNDPIPANILNLTSTTDITVATYSWTGPAGFTSILQNPTRASFGTADSGVYTVIVTTTFGCKDTATTDVAVFPPPGIPSVSGVLVYCQNATFIPFTIVPAAGATVYWYPSGAGGAGTTTTPTVNTAIPGTYTFYYGQSIGLCQSPIDSITVVVNPLPAVPIGTSNAPICADSVLKLFGNDATTGVSYHWSGPGGFTSILQNPTISNAQTSNSGLYTIIVTNTATGCTNTGSESVTVNTTPYPPHDSASNPCDSTTLYLFTNDLPGCTYSWNGPAGFTSVIQNPSIYPAYRGVNDGVYTVTATLGVCPSVPTTVTVAIRPEPVPPVPHDTMYCQRAVAVPLNYEVDSLAGSNLNWYLGSTLLTVMPIVNTAGYDYPTGHTWNVTQTVNGCESNPRSITVVVVPTPQFTITYRDWVCQHDSIMLAYTLEPGSALVSPVYNWSLPFGSAAVNGTNTTDPSVYVKFDSANVNFYNGYLVIGNLNYQCLDTASFSVKVVPQPAVHAYMNPNVCLGDTTTLAISQRSSGASIFSWYIDNTPLASSSEVNIVASNSNSGGPFSLSWNTTGVHYITVSCTTNEGCQSLPTVDTVNVRQLPDPTFTFKPKGAGTLCLEDSVEFKANDDTCYNCSYLWQPEHSFNNNNKPVIWGKVESSKSEIMLTVTDPYSCIASSTQTITPDACCTVLFPNAFTPNGDGKNDFFHPLFSGYHRFHQFRIVNRWGQTIFESANSEPRWDGTFGGVPEDMDVYYYYIKYDCGGKAIEEKGDVTLIR